MCAGYTRIYKHVHAHTWLPGHVQRDAVDPILSLLLPVICDGCAIRHRVPIASWNLRDPGKAEVKQRADGLTVLMQASEVQ